MQLTRLEELDKFGKHGAPKVSLTGINIFTGQKVEESMSPSSKVDVPIITSTNYLLIDIAADGSLTLMDEDESRKEDLKLPSDENFKVVRKFYFFFLG